MFYFRSNHNEHLKKLYFPNSNSCLQIQTSSSILQIVPKHLLYLQIPDFSWNDVAVSTYYLPLYGFNMYLSKDALLKLKINLLVSDFYHSESGVKNILRQYSRAINYNNRYLPAGLTLVPIFIAY